MSGRSMQLRGAQQRRVISPGRRDADRPQTTGVAAAPSALKVVCGQLQGTLLLEAGTILVAEGTPLATEVTPTEFEKIAGRAVAKKWRHTIRVALPDGQPGCALGDWLRAKGVQLHAQPPGRSAPKKAGSLPQTCEPAPALLCGQKRAHVACSTDSTDSSRGPQSPASSQPLAAQDARPCSATSPPPGCEPPQPPPAALPRPAGALGAGAVPVVCGALTGVLEPRTLRVVVAAGTSCVTDVDLQGFADMAGAAGATGAGMDSVRVLVADGTPRGVPLRLWLESTFGYEGLDVSDIKLPLHPDSPRGPASASPGASASGVSGCTASTALPDLSRACAPCARARPPPHSLPSSASTSQLSEQPETQGAGLLEDELLNLIDLEIEGIMSGSMEGSLTNVGTPSPAGSLTDALVLMTEYLAGLRPEAPLHMIGVLQAPMVCGAALDLRRLFRLVVSHGGYQAVTAMSLWSSIAADLGFEDGAHGVHAGFEVRVHYLDFLHRFEDTFATQQQPLQPDTPHCERVPRLPSLSLNSTQPLSAAK